jgi:hypothetical protein
MYKRFPWIYLFIFSLILILTTEGSAYRGNHFAKGFFVLADTIIAPSENSMIPDSALIPLAEGVFPDTIPSFQDTLQLSTGLHHNDSTILNDTLAPADTLTDTLDTPRRMRPPRHAITVPGQIRQQDEDLPKSAIPWFSEDQLQNPFALKPNYIDTTLLGFQMYDYAAQGNDFYAQKGNVGHAHRLLMFNPELTPGFKLAEYNIYGKYFFRHDDLVYYRPRHVFSELFYLTGSNREQLFYGKHNQKLHETFHLGFQYRIVNSPGAVTRINGRNSSFYFTGDYLSPDSRYQALASVIVNRIRNMESGGLKNHLGYEQEQVRDSVFLYRAESWAREMSINLRHFYQTGFYGFPDTTGTLRFINLGRINHNFSYTRTAFVFDDKERLTPFYNNPRMDTLNTFDSTAVHRLENMVSWSNFPLEGVKSTFPFNFRLYLKHSINTIQQPDFRPDGAPVNDEENKRIYYHTRSTYNQMVQGFELQSDQRRILSFGGYANVTLGGYNDEDFHAGAFLNFGRVDRNYTLETMLRYSLTEAPYFYQNISVNNIRWENSFDKMQIVNLSARLRFPFVRLEGNYYLLDKMVYLGRDAVPVQNTTELGLFSLGAYSDLRAGWFGFRNHVLLQQPTSQNFERFPTLISYHSVSLNFSLFDNSLINHLGIDFHFNTAYRAMAYMPVVRGFYIQDQHTISDKYLVDVFWNGKISNARLFVKYQNILGLAFNNRIHYDIPFYPIPETMFKFGVSWMFFD